MCKQFACCFSPRNARASLRQLQRADGAGTTLSLCQGPNSARWPSRTGSGLALAVATVSLHTSSQRWGRVRRGVTCSITEDEARDKVTPIAERVEKRAPGNYSTYRSLMGVKSHSFRTAQCSQEIK